MQGARNTWPLLVVVRRPERKEPSVRTTVYGIGNPNAEVAVGDCRSGGSRRGSGRDRREAKPKACFIYPTFHNNMILKLKMYITDIENILSWKASKTENI